MRPSRCVDSGPKDGRASAGAGAGARRVACWRYGTREAAEVLAVCKRSSRVHLILFSPSRCVGFRRGRRRRQTLYIYYITTALLPRAPHTAVARARTDSSESATAQAAARRFVGSGSRMPSGRIFHRRAGPRRHPAPVPPAGPAFRVCPTSRGPHRGLRRRVRGGGLQ